MNTVRCIIIEDEVPAQQVLRSYITKSGLLDLVEVFDDAVGAIEFLNENRVDLIFLDIQVPTLDGLAFLRTIKDAPQVIITTAYSEYAVDAFELDVRDYLKKPFSFERFLRAVHRITAKPDPAQLHHFDGKGTETSFAFFNVNKKMVRVQFDDILYIESMREYIYIHTTGGKVITKMGTGEIEKMLGTGFVRVHRSFIVNVRKVTAFDAEDVFINDHPIPIGMSYKKQVDTLFKKHIFSS